MRLIITARLLFISVNLAVAAETKLNVLSPAEAKDGFTLLFGAEDLDGWHGGVAKITASRTA